jgi:hypothetical protein
MVAASAHAQSSLVSFIPRAAGRRLLRGEAERPVDELARRPGAPAYVLGFTQSRLCLFDCLLIALAWRWCPSVLCGFRLRRVVLSLHRS